MTYCNCVWGTGSENKFKSLISCQKEQLDKYIAKVSAKTHSLPYFKKYNILKLDDLHKFLVQQLMYKYSNNLLPRPFANYFTLSHILHAIRVTQQTISYILHELGGPKLWNALSNELKKIPLNFLLQKKNKKILP